jgi:hypothetical protein
MGGRFWALSSTSVMNILVLICAVENISCWLLHWKILTIVSCSKYGNGRIHNTVPCRNFHLYNHFALPSGDG